MSSRDTAIGTSRPQRADARGPACPHRDRNSELRSRSIAVLAVPMIASRPGFVRGTMSQLAVPRTPTPGRAIPTRRRSWAQLR